ncbi:MAG: hypothetical protein JNN30_13650 [Rhodanobacteraceae bacterium]|nr:hypothetical protein [Rhodanobacteraceae bacterium]
MIEYNQARDHDSLGDLTPTEYRQRFVGFVLFLNPPAHRFTALAGRQDF